VPLISLGVFVAGVSQGDRLAWLLPGAIIAQNLSVLLQATFTGRIVKKRLVAEGIAVRKSVFDRKTFTAAFVAVFTHFWGVVRPLWIRQIEWRGITYRRTRGKQFDLVEYTPYQPDGEEGLAEVSI